MNFSIRHPNGRRGITPETKTEKRLLQDPLWLVAGAVLKCYEFEARGEVSRKISDAVRERKGEGYVSWNDDRATRYEEVFDLVKKLDV